MISLRCNSRIVKDYLNLIQFWRCIFEKGLMCFFVTMSKEFNIPPVVFPSGGNPNTGPQQRRLPKSSFQPEKRPTLPTGFGLWIGSDRALDGLSQVGGGRRERRQWSGKKEVLVSSTDTIDAPFTLICRCVRWRDGIQDLTEIVGVRDMGVVTVVKLLIDDGGGVNQLNVETHLIRTSLPLYPLLKFWL
ncbi:hypothetical protein L1887_26624 [Cichorium endivia]|nr:hypothetical protein L1887_26624 [Cichorium endivia]